MKNKPARGPSQRQLRVGELVRHALAGILQREGIEDPALFGATVTVTEVRMTPDLKLATAFLMPLGGHDVDAILEALEREKKHLRHEVARAVNLRYAPDLKFVADPSFDEGARIDALLRSDRVRRDLAADDERD